MQPDKTIVERIRSSLRYGLLTKTMLERLALRGIKIQPYFLVVEQLFEVIGKEFETGFEEFQSGFLGPEDMEVVSNCRNWNRPKEYYVNLLNEGKDCFGVKNDGELAAFMWVDLKACNYKGDRFPLKQNEAYFFDAWTLEKSRGKKIASFMRYECYKVLHGMGRQKFYSISEYFNAPAIKFKRRLGAENIKLGLFVDLFGKHHWTWELKRYD